MAEAPPNAVIPAKAGISRQFHEIPAAAGLLRLFQKLLRNFWARAAAHPSSPPNHRWSRGKIGGWAGRWGGQAAPEIRTSGFRHGQNPPNRGSGILPVAAAPGLDYLGPHVDLEIRQPA